MSTDHDNLRLRLEARVAERREEQARRLAAGTADAADPSAVPGATDRAGSSVAPAAAAAADAPNALNGTSGTDGASGTSMPGHLAEPPAWSGRPGPSGRPRAATSYPLARTVLRLVVVLLAAAAFAFGLRAWVVQPFWIPSESMEPTLHGCATCNPDRLLVDKLSYHLHPVHRGDVVVFARPPGAPSADADLVKRVVGLAGESVRASGGTVYINDHALTEPYVSKDCGGTRDFGPTTVPAGDVFVMGDNRCDSLDSRVFGPIRASTIVGRAFIIVWPLPRIHWL